MDDSDIRNLAGNMGSDPIAWHCIYALLCIFLCGIGMQKNKTLYENSILPLPDAWIYRGYAMVKELKGSTVVEMAYLMPVVLFTWVMAIFLLFHFHDKSILSGAAYESAIVGAELWNEERIEKEEKINRYFQERIRDKLLFYGKVESQVVMDDAQVIVTAAARRYRMNVKVEERALITNPEKGVREVLKWKELVEGEENGYKD